jgi:hypothetical protein
MNMLDYLKMIGLGGLAIQYFEDDGVIIGDKVPEYAMTRMKVTRE